MKRVSGSSLGIGLSLWLAGCVAPPTPINVTGLTEPVELAYVLNDQVWVYDADTTQHQGIQTSVAPLTTAVGSQPALLANGEAVVFVQTVAGAPAKQSYYEIWEYTFATQSSRLLATHTANPTQLRVAPNGQYLTYVVADVLYMTDLTAATSTRLHEGARDSAWSPNSRRIVYATTDDRILVREFDVEGSLTDPETLLDQAATALIFTDNHTLVYSGAYDTGFTLLEYNLNDDTVVPLTSLRFTTATTTDRIQLDATGERLLYERADDITKQPVVWLVYTKKDVAKRLIESAVNAVWSNTEDTIYYQTLEPTTITQSNVTGLNHTVFVHGGSAITSIP